MSDSTRHVTVLLIGNTVDRTIVSRLVGDDHRIVEATTATDARARIAEDAPDCVVLDAAGLELLLESGVQSEQRRLFRFLESVPVGIYVLDHEGRPYYGNSLAKEMLQLDPLDVPMDALASSYGAFVADTDNVYPVERMPIVRALKGEVSRVEDVEIRRPDGTPIRIEALASPIRNEKGDIEFAIAAFNDITDQHRLQVQLRQAQKMEAVGRLAGGVAHDFNNLLTAIFSFGTFVLEALDPADPAHADMEEVLRAANRGQDLTRQLLAFSRRQPIQPRVINFNQLVGNVDKMLRRILGEDIECTTTLDDSLWSVRVDPGVFEQVLVNLAVNARDAMRSGGRLGIETENVQVSKTDEWPSGARVAAGDYILLTVSDDGDGMDSETLESIFEPFFTTKGPGRGTGLGLSTCYGIVKQAGGFIWATSELGVGTTFQIYIPRAVGDAESLGAPVSTEQIGGNETILVVEDERQVRALTVRALRRYGYTVLEAASGEEALSICEQQDPGSIHVLLTDVIMPRMSGKQLVDRVAPMRPEMKVLYMSGYTSSAILSRGELDPGSVLLQKPFTPLELGRKVRELIDTP